MTKECIRLRNFLMDLDQLMLNNEYWDDDKGECVITITQDECYDTLMETKEYHLLTATKVRGFIKIFFEDYGARSSILRAFKAF